MECCKEEKNHKMKFIWVGRSKYDEGDYEPLYIYCSVCGIMVKDIGVGGYWSTINM
jgi:hypothetical protein